MIKCKRSLIGVLNTFDGILIVGEILEVGLRLLGLRYLVCWRFFDLLLQENFVDVARIFV